MGILAALFAAPFSSHPTGVRHHRLPTRPMRQYSSDCGTPKCVRLSALFDKSKIEAMSRPIPTKIGRNTGTSTLSPYSGIL
jgi:hypothetical protein